MYKRQIYDIGTWMEFWWRREKVEVRTEVEGDRVRIHISGPADGMGVALPASWDGRKLKAEGVELPGTGEVLLPAGEEEVSYEG